MGFWDGIKSFGNKIMDSVGSGINKVMDVAKGARDAVNSAYNTISKIPVIGQAVDALSNAPIPLAKMSLGVTILTYNNNEVLFSSLRHLYENTDFTFFNQVEVHILAQCCGKAYKIVSKKRFFV